MTTKSFSFFLLLLVRIGFAQCDYVPNADLTRLLDVSYFQAPFGANVIKGEYGVWYKTNLRNGNPNANRITKPFIICEGFDPTGSNGLKCIYESMDNSVNVDFLTHLRSEGFDIIILNLLTNGIEIEKNARLFSQLLGDIQTEISNNGSTHKPVVMGISMGGLITRIALARMGTTANYSGLPSFYGLIPANVEKYISFDAPHKGANVPLGYEHMVSTVLEPFLLLNQLGTLLPNGINPARLISSFTSSFNAGFEQAAPLQLVMNYYANNPKRSFFRTELTNAGYPNVYRRIGIANGAWNGTKQPNIDARSKMLDWNGGICIFDEEIDTKTVIGKIYFSLCPVKIDVRTYAMPGNSALGMVSRIYVGTKIGIGLSDFNNVFVNRYAILHDYLNAPNDQNVDHVPGGVYNIFALESLAEAVNSIPPTRIQYEQRLKFELLGFPMDILLWEIDQTFESVFGKISGSPFNFSFVPTVSALDINTDNWFYNAASLGNYPRGRNTTPFDAIYADNNNDSHAFMEICGGANGNMADFMASEISPRNLYIQNRTFPVNYRNTFEARGNITVGRNVDPEPGRSDVGNVQMSEGGSVVFSVGAGMQVNFEDGFDSGNSTIEIVENNILDGNPNLGNCTNNPRSNRARKAMVSEQEEYKYDLQTGKDNQKEYETSSEELSYSIYPNPFSDITKLEFSVKEDMVVSVKILSANLGEIATLVNAQYLQKGTYTYDFKSSNLQNGLYFAEITTPKGRIVGKIIILR